MAERGTENDDGDLEWRDDRGVGQDGHRRGKQLLPARERPQGIPTGEFEDEPLSVEGYGEVLLVGGGRKDQRGSRVVLPGAVGGGREHQGLRGFLERR